jgi:hypothetical protein
MKFENPSALIKLIEDNARLCEIVEQGYTSPDRIFDELQKVIPKADLMPILRGCAIIALGKALDGERKRIRRAIKEGKEVVSVFKWQVASEIESEARFEAILDEKFSGIASALSQILDQWVMDNGKPLRAVTAGYLRDTAAKEEGAAKGHARNAAFYRGVAEGLPDDAIIGQHVSPAHAEAIRMRVFQTSLVSLKEAA